MAQVTVAITCSFDTDDIGIQVDPNDLDATKDRICEVAQQMFENLQLHQDLKNYVITDSSNPDLID